MKTDAVRPADPTVVERALKCASLGDSPKRGLLSQFLMQRVPIHFGGMSDPFQNAERKWQVTKSYLESLLAYQYPTVISTKGNMVTSEPYLSLLKQMQALVVQFSFSTTIDERAGLLEEGPAPSSLLKAMERLSREGVLVTCRWQPYIPGFSENPTEFVRRMSSVGCHHVALEHLKLPMEKNIRLRSRLASAVGSDLYTEFNARGWYRDAREFVLTPENKVDKILEVREAVHAEGMTFGSADNELQYLSDTSCCCSGIDQFRGFENWFKHQIGYAVRRCQGKSIVYQSIAGEWVPKQSVDRYLNSHSRLRRKGGDTVGTIREHILSRWNGTVAYGGPSTFFGVKDSGQRDAGGNTIYQWDFDRLGPVIERVLTQRDQTVTKTR